MVTLGLIPQIKRYISEFQAFVINSGAALVLTLNILVISFRKVH